MRQLIILFLLSILLVQPLGAQQTIVVTGGTQGLPGPGATPVNNNTLFGNVSGATALPTAITPAQATAVLNVFNSTAQGLVPASGGGTTTFLRADGTFAVPPGSGDSGTPGGSNGQIQYNNDGSFGGFTVSGDATVNTTTGAITVTKTNGTDFAASATTDTTNASNITGGTLPTAQLPTPTASALGGIESLAPVSHKWIDTISTAGVPSATQPVFADISGTLTNSQLPASGITAGTYQGITFNAEGIATAATNESYLTANQTITLSGDVSGSGTTAITTTLATVNPDVGTYGSSTTIPTITTNGKGLVTAVTTNAVIAPASTLTGTTLASNVVSSSLASVGTITSGIWNGTPNTISYGGTGQTTANAAYNALSPMTTLGDIEYENSTPAAARLAGNITTTKKFLTQTGTGTVSAIPGWNTIANSDLPDPTTSALGGVEAVTAVSNSWINSINTSGVPQLSQPAFSNLSGTATAAQLPSTAVNSVGNLSPLFTSSISSQALGFTLSSASADSILGNNTGSSAAPAYNTISSYLDTFGSSQGDILYRGASGWTVLPPGTSGYFLMTQGSGEALVWAATSGGGGTVTSFGAGNLSPLFTTSVATNTTTPALSFSLSSAAANTIFCNTSGSSAAPSYNSLSISAGTGLSGGGNLTSSPTISMATGIDNTLAGYNGSGVFSDVAIGSGLSLSSGTLSATGSGGVSSITGDGSLVTNSASIGAVTLSLGNTSQYYFWGRSASGSGVPSYQQINCSYLAGSASAAQMLALTSGDVYIGNGSNQPAVATMATLTGDLSIATASAQGVIPALTDAQIVVGKTSSNVQAVTVTGDWTISDSGVATLATVNSDTGSFGSSTAIPSFTVNGKGLITAISTDAVVAPAGTLTGTTLASNVVSSSLTSVGTITSGTWNGTAIAYSALSGAPTINSGTSGELAYYSASSATISSAADAAISAGALSLGKSTSVLGSLVLYGNTSGSVTIEPNAIAGSSIVCTLPAANSNPIQPLSSATSNEWVQYINSSGVQELVQPAFSNLSGNITAAQMLALTSADIYVGNSSNQPAAVAMSGDATLANTGAITLATVNSNVGTYQGLTINAKGQVTAATNESYLTGNQTTTLSGDVSGSGTTTITATLATINSNTGSFGSSTAIPSFTVNGKGLITAASTNAVIAPAGTLTGTTLASNVVSSSLTAVGTITTGTWDAGAVTSSGAITEAGVAGVICANAALATSATSGFLYIPSCAGTPTGTPTSETGTVPLVFDSSNDSIYLYYGSAWNELSSGGGGSGTVNSGSASQIAYYASGGTAVSGAYGMIGGVTTANTTATIAASSASFVTTNPGSTAATLTLPAANSCSGKVLSFEYVGGTATTTLQTNQTNEDTFDGATYTTTIPLNSSGQTITFISDGGNPGNWRTISPLLSAGGSGGSGSSVTSFSGDGSLLTNSSSTGSVTATLGNAGPYKVWGNSSGSSGAPSYVSLTTGMLPASAVTATSTLGTGFVKATGSNNVAASAVTICKDLQIVGTLVNQTILLNVYAPFGYTITGVDGIQTTSGTCTAAFQIGGTNITGLSAVSITSSPQNVSASGANTVSTGNQVAIVITSASGSGLQFTLVATRTQ